MNKLLKYLVYLSILSIIVGPFGVLPLGIPQVNIYFTDIVIGLIGLIWIFKITQVINFIKTDSISKYFCIFAGITIISLILTPLNLNTGEKLISGLYIVRLFSYFLVYLTVKKLTSEKIIHPQLILKFLSVVGLILAGLGWLQYFLYPDLRNLYYLGWDPHFKRIFSTFLDPNYFGLVMVLALIVLFSHPEFISGSRQMLNRVQHDIVLNWISKLVIFTTLMFTYSRSSFLALIAAVVYIFAVKKKYKFIGGFLAIIIVSMLLLPRPGGVGVQLERVFSIETRIGNWQQALKVFSDHPVLGIGFNTIRYAKSQYNFGQDNLAESHAGAGFDNSFLFIAASSGIVGFLFYLLFFGKIFTKGSLLTKSSLVAIVVHSLFLNSLFFPWIMLWMWVLAGLGRDSPTSSG